MVSVACKLAHNGYYAFVGLSKLIIQIQMLCYFINNVLPDEDMQLVLGRNVLVKKVGFQATIYLKSYATSAQRFPIQIIK